MNLITRAKDTNKDQTYFIWQIKQQQLPHILFPVGEFDVKADVRAFAESKGLVTSSKPDSQGLCFVGQTSLRDMLLQTLGRKDGFIYTYLTQEQIDKIGLKVTKKNREAVNSTWQFKIKLGTHEGAFLYTIGQRQNLGISNGPWFVAQVDIVNNEVIVCHIEFQESIESNIILVKDLNWHLDITQNSIYTKSKEILNEDEKLKLKNTLQEIEKVDYDNYKIYKLRLKAQIRYRSEAKACAVFVFENYDFQNPPDGVFRLNKNYPSHLRCQPLDRGNRGFAIVEFDESIKAAAKGQSIVFYDFDTDQCLIGGGIIESSYKN